MDYALFETEDPVDLCDGIASVERGDYTLCLGCAGALDALLALGKAGIRK